MMLNGLQVAERSYDAEPLSHHHTFCQVLLPAQGRLTVNCAGERGWVGGGQVAVIPPGAEHGYFAVGPNRFVVVNVSVGQPEVTPIWERGRAFRPQDTRLVHLTGTLQVEARSGGLHDPLVADALLRYLTAALTSPAEPRVAVQATGAHQQLAAAAETYLREHFRLPITVADVAATTGVSASHLHRIFRAATGTTLVSYVHRLRLETAAELLRETDHTVIAVAHEVGFASQAHLTRLFTRSFGCTPGRYRAQARPRN